ncbi:MAG: ATP-grasp domain-containing protein [Planctomycetales bacterium]|nr:ATP-grasp domain-containing protein [Planctomycetales bacterium]
MTRIFIYEFVSGGGFLGQELPPPSLFREGFAMASTLASDFAQIDDTEVRVLQDQRFASAKWSKQVRATVVGDPAERAAAWQKHVPRADYTVVIAPEFDKILWRAARDVLTLGGNLLGPSADLIAWASDKSATAMRLAAANIPVPQGQTGTPTQLAGCRLSFPRIVKWNDGAGSLAMCTLTNQAEFEQWLRQQASEDPTRLWRVETQHAGKPASVGMLLGPHERVVFLPPCWQHLSNDGCYAYQGCSPITDPQLTARATQLAQRCYACFRSTTGIANATCRTKDSNSDLRPGVGYIGVDILLDTENQDPTDCVVEVNPRLTTSYVGLRHGTSQNLAHLMLDVAAGGHSELVVSDTPWQLRVADL